jgi:mevalonate kinase
VATAAALLRLGCAVSGAGLCELGSPPSGWLPCINEWAFAAEVVMTGTPSGIDNTVSCYGNAVRFRKASPLSLIEHLAGFPSVRILLTNTKVARETKALVAKVRELHGLMPAVFDLIFDAMEAVSDSFLARVREGNPDGHPEAAGTLQELVRVNHNLLGAIKVGHPALDEVCRLGTAHGFESKLTGAGGGGCAYTLLGPRPNDSRLEEDTVALVKALREAGFDCYESTIAGSGVLWVEPPEPQPIAQDGAPSPPVKK